MNQAPQAVAWLLLAFFGMLAIGYTLTGIGHLWQRWQYHRRHPVRRKGESITHFAKRAQRARRLRHR